MSLGVVDLFNVESLHINDVHRHNIILESKHKDSGFEEPQVSSMRTVVAWFYHMTWSLNPRSVLNELWDITLYFPNIIMEALVIK